MAKQKAKISVNQKKVEKRVIEALRKEHDVAMLGQSFQASTSHEIQPTIEAPKLNQRLWNEIKTINSHIEDIGLEIDDNLKQNQSQLYRLDKKFEELSNKFDELLKRVLQGE